jgi:uncharacterized protein (DUF488 family)
MMFERQRLLLTLLDALREPVNNTDFQKLLFFFTQECEKTPSYEFVPYKFGGFSFTSYADKRRLTNEGFLVDSDNWELTTAGCDAARKNAVSPLVVSAFCRKYRHLRGNMLVAEQYRKHPYYAIRSEIVEKVLPDAESRKRIIQEQPAKIESGLLTIGYEGRSLEAYLNLLLKNSVTLLCDVRRNPLSRKYGFSKSTLNKTCEGVGIRYEHLPELGIDSEERRDLKTQSDYDALFAIYEHKSLPQQAKALEQIHNWLKQGERVALTCFEKLPHQCHRHCVSEALEQSENNLAVLHL